jgi:hypothetical protein
MAQIVQTPTQHITGELLPKRVAAYMKQSHKENTIRVQRREDGSFFIADGYAAVNVPQHPDLFPYTFFPAEWERATFAAKEMTPTKGGPDIESLWARCLADEMQSLTLTHYLYEIAGARNRPGHFYRKLATYELTQEISETLLKKQMCDLLSPDIDELEGFLFEQESKDKPVRVAARNGYVAILMPFFKK